MKKLAIITTILVVLGLGSYLVYYSFFQNKVERYLVLDINPSLEMGLSEDDEVLSVTPLNSDADILLSNIDLIGLNVEEASEIVVDEAIETGFINEYNEDNTITVYSTDEDEDDRDELQTTVVERLNHGLEEKDVHALVVSGGLTDEMKAEADTYDISYGKFLLVSRLAAISTDYTKDEIVNMSVKEIQSNIKTIVNERRDAISEDDDEQKTKLETQKQEKINAYEQEKIQLENQLLIQYQQENDVTLTDSQKAELGKTLLEQEKDKIKDYVDKVIQNIKTYQNSNKQVDANTISKARNSVKSNSKNR
jgi:hypothetical protein